MTVPMDRTNDLEMALSSVVHRVVEQAKASGRPLNQEERLLLQNLPLSNGNHQAYAPELGPPETCSAKHPSRSGIARLAVCICRLYSPPSSDVGTAPLCRTGISQAEDRPTSPNCCRLAIPKRPADPCIGTLDLIPIGRHRSRLHCRHGLVVLRFQENPRTAIGAGN